MWKKDSSDLGILCPTDRTFRKVESHADAGLLPHVRGEVERLRDQYQFLHWHLAFPDVFRLPGRDEAPENDKEGWSGGFDAVLGNPPWERVKLQEKEWFAEHSPDIANAPNAAARKRLIDALKANDPALHERFLGDSRKAEGESHLMRNSGRYPLCGRGDINVYTVFAEGMRSVLNRGGRMGAVLPSGIATDDTTKFYFQDLVEKNSLRSLFDFENKRLIFAAVAPVVKFCIFTSGSAQAAVAENTPPSAEFAFFCLSVEDLGDPDKRFALSPDDIALLNPNTRTCPIFRSRRDAELTKAIYRRVPVLIREARDGQPEENPWGITFNRMFDMSNDSHRFRTREQLEAEGWTLDGNRFRKADVDGEYLPLYEAKLFHHYNHRPSTFEGIPVNDRFKVKAPTNSLTQADLANPHTPMIPRYWVRLADVRSQIGDLGWVLAFRDMTNVMTNSRNAIFTVLPLAGVGHSAPVVIIRERLSSVDAMINFDSFGFDYATRQKLAGGHLTYFILKQLPFLLPEVYEKLCRWTVGEMCLHDWLLPRGLELAYTAWDLEPFAQDYVWSGPPFRWDEERRFLIRCELDAAFFHLYLLADPGGDWSPPLQSDGCPHDETPEQLAELKQYFPTPRDAVAYIMDTFPIVRRKDEEKYNGDYRTKRIILEIYDAMLESIRNGKPYQTRLDPPPGPPADPLPEWLPGVRRPANWPAHIHPPRGVHESH